MQLLMGDRIDNIPGVYGIGPVNAKRIIDKCKTSEEMWDACLAEYAGDIATAIRNGKLLHIRQRENEVWEPPARKATGSHAADRGLTSAGEQTIGVPS
jgi:5'-3' exonuclease